MRSCRVDLRDSADGFQSSLTNLIHFEFRRFLSLAYTPSFPPSIYSSPLPISLITGEEEVGDTFYREADFVAKAEVNVTLSDVKNKGAYINYF